VARFGSIPLLKLETEQRLRKRQTGNEKAYAALTSWIDRWRLSPSSLAPRTADQIVEGLLAFPLGDFFWEKVFEVWCLQEVLLSLERIGCTLKVGPLPLYRRSSGPIAEFASNSHAVLTWFQRQLPIGSPRWRYESSGKGLRGMPDIVVSNPDRGSLIIDAKYRRMVTSTRSEETYKILGYAENFRDSRGKAPFAGILIFVDYEDVTSLRSPDGGRISLIGVRSDLADKFRFQGLLDREIGHWLAATSELSLSSSQ
jgi:hypothetical protein